MHPQRKAYLYAFAAIACWSTVGSAFKISLRYLDPVALLFFSSLVACLILFIILLARGKIGLLRTLTLKQVLLSAFLGMLNPFLYYLVLFKAYDMLQAQEAASLNYIWPLVLVLLSIPILKQRISILSIFAILVSFTGIIIISTHGQLFTRQFANPAGVMLAAGSAVFWALYWIFNLKDPREEVSKLFLNFCFGFLYTAIMIAVSGGMHLPGWKGLTGSVYIGIFEMGLTFVLWLYALKFSSTTAKVSNLVYLSPFMSLIIIHLTVGETILISTVTGLFFIIGGILLQEYLKR